MDNITLILSILFLGAILFFIVFALVLALMVAFDN